MIVLYGPTGVGKTELSLLLAQHLPVEIITMDTGSLYEPLTIGTAKPDWKAQPVPHHLFDHIKYPDLQFSAMDYRRLVSSLLPSLEQQGTYALAVGGSGFYLKSLLWPARDSGARGTLETSAPTEELYNKLRQIDPARAAALNPHDRYRIIRALTIWHTTGTAPSLYQPLFEPLEKTVVIHLTRDRDDLYSRINERVVAMIDAGWIDEVAHLNDAWKAFVCEKKVIGYDDIVSYLRHNGSFQQLIATIQTKTRNYAKRQETFWRMLLKNIQTSDPHSRLVRTTSINLTYTNVELYIKQLLHDIAEFLP